MIKEIYTKDPQDPNYQIDVIEHNDVYETVLSTIKMILYTKSSEVLGDTFFGVNLEEYVFSMSASNNTIRENIEKQIAKYVPESLVMAITVEVNFKKGDYHDTCLIDINIDGSNAMGLIIT